MSKRKAIHVVIGGKCYWCEEEATAIFKKRRLCNRCLREVKRDMRNDVKK